MALPKIVYIYEEEDSDGTKYLVASTNSHEQIEGVIGVYKLQETLYVRCKPQFRRAKTKTWFDKK